MSSQSHACAILFLMSDTLPRLKFASFVFPSERVVLIISLAASGRFRINSTAFEANAARPSIDAFHSSLNGFSSLMRSVHANRLTASLCNVNRPTAEPTILRGKRNFSGLIFAAQDQYRVAYEICCDDLRTAPTEP